MAKEIPILVIEEDDGLRELVRHSLSSQGFEVYTAANGPSGVEAAYKHKPRLILLDVADGLEDVVSELKLNSHTSHIPVIVLTEADSIEGPKQPAEICVDDHIAKPFDNEKLAEIVKFKLENCEAVMGKTPRRKGRIPVLVIDDEEDIRKLVKYNLYYAGFEVYTAKDGPSGIKAARKYKPHLILLDVTMPGMDGLEVLFNLKWNKKTKHIPVFMLTAKSTLEDIDHAYAKRADDYITKPFDGEKLRKTVKQKLENLEMLKK